MPRDSHIPIFLWVATAVLLHLFSGGGLEQGARVSEQLKVIRDFADDVRSHVRTRMEPPVEVTLLDDEAPADEVRVEVPPEKDAAPDGEDPLQVPPDSPRERLSPEKLKPDEAPKERPAVEEAKPKEVEKPTERQPTPLPAVVLKNRVAVKQHVKDNDQSNPDADFIADNANKVDEQTQARITATDNNDPDPNPGSHLGGPKDAPGNADETELAQSEDKPGAEKPAVEPVAAAQKSVDLQKLGLQAQKAEDAEKAQAARRAQEAAPEVPNALKATDEGFAVAEAQSAREGRAAAKRRQGRQRQRATDFLGLGAQGTTENGVNLNLSPSTAVAAIGQEQLRRDREHDAERRRSRHRGSYQSMGLEKWRSAIENYVPSVKLGNTTALNTAAVPFAGYLNEIHNRLHPVFAMRFLGSLDRLPNDHVMNGKELSTNLEIVIDQESGKLVRMGVTKTSGVTAFDVAALEAVHQSQPFGPPPKAIVSPDGRVYLHWEFYRDPFYACSTYFARPFMLKAQPKSAPPSLDEPLRPPFQKLELPSQQEQHGTLSGESPRRARARL